jgi:putative SOS response-associated peptidase YedK
VIREPVGHQIIAPGDRWPILIPRATSPDFQFSDARWGWTELGEGQPLTELPFATAATATISRNAWRFCRCLVPAYRWNVTEPGQGRHLYVQPGPDVWLAGLWLAHGPEGDEKEFALLTQPDLVANPPDPFSHPVAVHESEWGAWLSGASIRVEPGCWKHHLEPELGASREGRKP